MSSDHLNYLTIVDENGNEQVIETTDSHPFWVVTDEPDLDRAARSVVDENGVVLYHENLEPGLNGYWVEAKDLRVGDVFLGADGELSTLTNIVRVEQNGGIAVFNFEVEGNHNYFILAKEYDYGQTCVLVHNATIDCKVTDVFRGGNTLILEDIKHVKIKDGLVQPTHGLSLNLDPNKVSIFGGAYQVKSIPDDLQIIQRGKDPLHYEIVHKFPMAVEQYKLLLSKVVLE